MSQIPALTSITDQALQERVAQAQHDARDAYAGSTLTTYKHGVQRFVRWCDETGRQYTLPVPPRMLADFIDDMSDALAPASIRLYVSAINRMHSDLDLASPAGASVVRLALKRMSRGRAKPQRQAHPMTRDAVDAALAQLGDDLTDLRDGALIALAYDTLCRSSELVALTVADVEKTSGGGGVVYIAKSKTDQEGEGAYRYIAPDTLQRLTDWIDAARLDPDAFLFFSLSPVEPSTGPRPHIAAREVSRIFKRRVGMEYTGHSTRVGGAVDQLSANIETAAIAQAGGWKSEKMVLRYTRKQNVHKGGAAQLAWMQGRA